MNQPTIKNKKILIADKLSPEGIAALKKYSQLQIIEAIGKPRVEILRLVADVAAIIVRSETTVDKELIAAAPALVAIGRAGVGVDNIDIAAATERGIVVMNAPEGNTIATCELTLAHIINSYRPFARAVASMQAGQWDKKNLLGVELHGKTLGILGLGRVGTQVAKRALAFGMKVIAYDPYLTPDRAQALGVAKTTLEQILKTADVITLHLPLTPQTTRLINKKTLAQAKKGIKIINCARGELIDEGDLIEALDNGTVGYAGLDVFAAEPLAEGSPLRKHPRVALTPHLGASTVEAQASVGIEIAQSIAELILHGQVRNAINAPSLGLQELERLRPWIALASRMGTLAQALAPAGTTVLELSIATRMPSGDLTAISRAVMRGYIAAISGGGINDVNAPLGLERMGITWQLRQDSSNNDYSDYLQLRAVQPTSSYTLGGALIGATRQPRLVSINNIPIEIALEGQVYMVVENQDVPGIVGHVGGILAAAGVNIANMSLGRTGQTAITLLQLDTTPNTEVIAKLKGHKSILSVQVVCL